MTEPILEHRLTIGNWPGGLEQLLDAVRRLTQSWALSEETADTLCLVLEELVANVFEHGFERPGGEVVLRLSRSAGRLEVELVDGGKPFDPLAQPPPDLDAGIEERSVGGLGIHLAKSLMDDISYHRAEGLNHLVLTKQLEATGPAAGPRPGSKPKEA